MKLTRILRTPARVLLASATLIAAATAQATPPPIVQCATGTVPLQTTQWSRTVTVPKFDPALGVLKKVTYSLSTQIQGTARFESLDKQPANVTLNFTAQSTLQRPDTSVLLQVNPTQNFVQSVSSFDGTVDFRGTSGATFPNITASASTSGFSPPPGSDLALFTGLPGNPGTITLPVVTIGTSVATGTGNIISQFQQQASATVTVCYEYYPDCNGNGVEDYLDIQNGLPDRYGVSGSTITCAPDGIPDVCQPVADCDTDGLPNVCELQAGAVDTYGVVGSTITCSPDGIPDSCQPVPDCDNDGSPNRCEILAGAADLYGVVGSTITCAPDGIPDSCQPVADCDKDGLPNRCEILAGAADVYGVVGSTITCTPDGIPDSCQPVPDCDNDGIPNRCEILAGAADTYGVVGSTISCTPDGIPDSCQVVPDCDNDGIPNRCEILAGAADTYGVVGSTITCTPDGIPDSCQPVPDCDNDGIPNRCEILAGAVDVFGVTASRVIVCAPDGVPDSCQQARDCDNDGIPNVCEIQAGAPDVYGVVAGQITCAPDDTPDSCQPVPDCDNDGVPDRCEILAGAHDVYGVVAGTITCAADGIPDSCQPVADCDNDGIPNRCEILAGAADRYGVVGSTITCTPDGIPDSCQPVPDCDNDGIPNVCALQAGAVDVYGVSGSTITCTGDGVPDSCQPVPDCDHDGIPDACAILAGAADCNHDGVPNSCEPDCNADGTPDVCEVDCNQDGVPDECQVLPDCNGNGIPDVCDLAQPGAQDCNQNGIPDECETDCDGNGRPDDCDIAANPAIDGDGDGLIDVCECKPLHRREPGSLLLYTEYDNREMARTILTVSNVHPSRSIDVHFVFVDSETCQEFDFTRRLTPKDTLSMLTRFVNPTMGQGFVFAYAQDIPTGKAAAFDYLVGELESMDGITTLSFALNAVAFKGIGDGTFTDLDNDGHRDLNGLEYSEAPDQILIPRFLGQGPDVESELVFVGLTGGGAYATTLSFEIFNDNEELFSSQYTFHCWSRVNLSAINGAFGNAFLKTTAHAPNEILGLPTRESGWIRIDGLLATSTVDRINDPAFYAVLIERNLATAVADLPFELCSQSKGSLLPLGPTGDNED